MEASDQFDGKRRRVKEKKRRVWAKSLVRPLTFKSVVAVGTLVTRVLWLLYKIINIFHE